VNNTASAKDCGQTPLYVDMDGTLLRTDLLAESFFALLKHNPFYLLLVPFWLLRGRAWLKQQIAARVDIDVEVLPYHAGFLEYLRNEAGRGRELYLATASNGKFAQAVAGYLGCFTGVLASDARETGSIPQQRRCFRSRTRRDHLGIDNRVIAPAGQLHSGRTTLKT
jgi:hypothetical protein